MREREREKESASVSTPCVKRADGNAGVTEEQTTLLATEQEISRDREVEGGRRANTCGGEEHLRGSCTPALTGRRGLSTSAAL